jgi:hypothetical protein
LRSACPFSRAGDQRCRPEWLLGRTRVLMLGVLINAVYCVTPKSGAREKPKKGKFHLREDRADLRSRFHTVQ